MPTAMTQKTTRIKPITSVNDGIGQLLKAINKADAADVPRVMQHFQQVLLPRVLDFLADKLLDALKSKLPKRRERAFAALVAMGTPAVMPIAHRLVRGKNLPYRLRLVELLGDLGKTERAPLLPLMRCLHLPDLRPAALVALGKMGVSGVDGPSEDRRLCRPAGDAASENRLLPHPRPRYLDVPR